MVKTIFLLLFSLSFSLYSQNSSDTLRCYLYESEVDSFAVSIVIPSFSPHAEGDYLIISDSSKIKFHAAVIKDEGYSDDSIKVVIPVNKELDFNDNLNFIQSNSFIISPKYLNNASLSDSVFIDTFSEQYICF